MDISHLIHQKSYEKVEMVLRRHFFTFLPSVLLFVILCAIPVAVYGMTGVMFPRIFTNIPIFTVSVLLGSVYILSLLLFFFTGFIDFYLDIWIITNDRIIDVEQFGLFSRTISELELYQIQDVTTDIRGIFATFLDYGTVTVKTASTNTDIIFHMVPRPNAVRRRLLELVQVDRRYHFGQMKS